MAKKIILIIVCIVFIGFLVSASMVVNRFSEFQYYKDSQSGELILGESDIIDSVVDEDVENKEEEEKEMGILELTSETFEEEVLKSDKTVLIDFYADWCGPCKMMAPVVERIASENPDIKVCKVNIDNAESLAINYRVMSIPTFMVVKNGEVVNRIVGAVDKAELESAIK